MSFNHFLYFRLSYLVRLTVSLNWPKRRHEIRIWAMLLDRRTSWASCLHRFIDIQNSHLGTLGTSRTIKRWMGFFHFYYIKYPICNFPHFLSNSLQSLKLNFFCEFTVPLFTVQAKYIGRLNKVILTLETKKQNFFVCFPNKVDTPLSKQPG